MTNFCTVTWKKNSSISLVPIRIWHNSPPVWKTTVHFDIMYHNTCEVMCFFLLFHDIFKLVFVIIWHGQPVLFLQEENFTDTFINLSFLIINISHALNCKRISLLLNSIMLRVMWIEILCSIVRFFSNQFKYESLCYLSVLNIIIFKQFYSTTDII